jgi:hypothetical protein
VGPITLDPAVRVEVDLERIGRRCLTHLFSNEQAALTARRHPSDASRHPAPSRRTFGFEASAAD